MSEKYDDRTPTMYIDGTEIWVTPEDEQHEREIADKIEPVWKCEFRRFAKLAPIDWYCLRTGRIVGLAEMKDRDHDTQKYETVYLSVRKWLALQLASSGMGIPGMFIVQFTDEIRWINIGDVNAKRFAMGGTKRIQNSRGNIEPIIHVPLEKMKKLDQ